MPGPSPQQVNYVRGLLVERSYYVSRGEDDSVAKVDAELRRCGVNPQTGGALEDTVERPGGGKASDASPRVESRGGKGAAGGGN